MLTNVGIDPQVLVVDKTMWKLRQMNVVSNVAIRMWLNGGEIIIQTKV